MTLICASIFIDATGDIQAALDRARAAVVAGARLIEWRVDRIASEHDAPKLVQRLLTGAPSPCILTPRTTSEGGEYDCTDAELAQFVQAIVSLPHHPRYLDIELARFAASADLRAAITRLKASPAATGSATSLILSEHDFDGRPRNLTQSLESMSTHPLCDVMKVAWMARSLRDNLEVFDILRERHKPTIALCMGPFGEMSRILAPKFNALLTFASDSPGYETAPGQLSVQQLRGQYRFDSINPDTTVLGIIGWPVAHSRSPRLHNTALAAVGENAVYVPLPIAPGYEPFKATVASLIDQPRLNFRGASVTIPHKEHLLRFVKERGGRLDEVSTRAGAANTLIVGSAGAVACANTDVPAAVESLCAGMGIGRKDLAQRKVAILGAGGVARAVAVGCAELGANVIIFNRSQDRARSLAAALASLELQGKVVAGKPGRVNCGCFDIIINCTSVGMAGGPAPHASPLDLLVGEGQHMPLDEGVTVFDTVYTPPQTPLISMAAGRGARTITGTDMFLHQARLQFKLWTGADVPSGLFERLMANDFGDS